MTPFAPRRPTLSLACALVFLVATACPRWATAADDSKAGIARTMDASVRAWSAGDLTAFMDSYEDSPDTLFVGAKGVVAGKAAIQARYASQFGTGGPGQLGKLSFDTLEVRPLGERHALMIGRYHLQPPDPAKPEATGIFSLVFHERNGRWRIVCDHTS